jgi:hypothetical protein
MKSLMICENCSARVVVVFIRSSSHIVSVPEPRLELPNASIGVGL